MPFFHAQNPPGAENGRKASGKSALCRRTDQMPFTAPYAASCAVKEASARVDETEEKL
ncbi:hypothetical protein HMPREF3293_02984 [Christensenella minuta]|uniref:Uncharacterized protein n=1 Tax=Christensenella minuta TaxID=626937 RepID=A0A136Q0V3_9FIRM|nr:hypothetical protein HMPREF3293_02984 [Christensenella minuta]